MDELTNIFIRGITLLTKEQYNPKMVARYAFEFYLDNRIENKKLEYVVDYLAGMDASPEFELTKEELLSFIEKYLL